MKAYEIIKLAMRLSERSQASVSRSLGRANNYLAEILKRKASPSCETMALILDELNFDLIARNRISHIEYKLDIPDNDFDRQLLEKLSDEI